MCPASIAMAVSPLVAIVVVVVAVEGAVAVVVAVVVAAMADLVVQRIIQMLSVSFATKVVIKVSTAPTSPRKKPHQPNLHQTKKTQTKLPTHTFNFCVFTLRYFMFCCMPIYFCTYP